MAATKRGSAFLLAILITSSTVLAGPNRISYQGHLNDQNGVPVSGSIAFVFSIYKTPTGGSAVWTENQTLPVSNGIFNAQLGAVNPIPASAFLEDALYLGVRVGVDQEMSPRQQITAAAYAQKADIAPFRMRMSPSFFGSGGDGVFSSGATQSLTRGRVYEFSSFDLTAGGVLRATGGSSDADPIVIKVAGNCSIAGTIDLVGGGMAAGTDVPGTLKAGQTGPSYGSYQGGGGGGGGAGAMRCGDSAVGGGAGGCPVFQAFAFGPASPLTGAGGGGGGQGYDGTSHVTVGGGAGGRGGGALILFVAGDLTITGTITVAGEQGGAGGGVSAKYNSYGPGGGGGGGGGSIVIYHASRIIDTAGVYVVAGGGGGAGTVGQGSTGTNGGRGGDGRLVVIRVGLD